MRFVQDEVLQVDHPPRTSIPAHKAEAMAEIVASYLESVLMG